MKKLVLFIFLAVIGTCAFAQARQYRLVSTGTYSADAAHNYQLADSVIYSYSNGRGSNMKTGVYLYDSMFRYRLSGSSLGLSALYYRTYGDSDRIITQAYAKRKGAAWQNVSRNVYAYYTNVRYDSTVADNWDSVGNVWLSNHRYKYYYTGTRLDSIFWRKNVAVTWLPEAKELNEYQSGNLIAHHLMIWNDTTAAWDSFQREDFGYDTASRLIEDTLYTYDSAAAMLIPISRENYAYDSNGRVGEHTYSSWSETFDRWDGTYQHYYTYLNNGLVDIEVINQWDIIAQAWGPYKRLQYNYDVNQNPTYTLEKAFSGWTYLNSMLETWYYNTDKLPVTHNFYTWDDQAAKWYPMEGEGSQTFYHYELIPDAIAVAKIGLSGIRVYPNPARDVAYINLHWNEMAPFIIRIYNLQGQVVYRASRDAAVEHTLSVNISGLPSGQYIIKADNGKEEMTNHLIIGNQ